jgi:hypothetical protein
VGSLSLGTHLCSTGERAGGTVSASETPAAELGSGALGDGDAADELVALEGLAPESMM